MSKKEKELRRIIEIPESLLKRGGDPFAIDVKEALLKINQNRLSDMVRSLKLEAEALNSISKVVEAQQGWVVEALKGLRLDPELIRERIRGMRASELFKVISRHAYPAVGIQRISRERIRAALEYFGLVDPWGRRPSLGPVSRPQEEAQVELQLERELEREAMEFYNSELKGMLERGPVQYRDVVGKGEQGLRRAFYIAYLSGMGLVSVRRDPLSGETLIVKPGGGDYESVAIGLE